MKFVYVILKIILLLLLIFIAANEIRLDFLNHYPL